MTVSVVAATGVDVGSAGTGTSKMEPYVGVAAGRMAILGAYARPATATLNTPSGWSLVGTRAGGSGVEGSGTGTGTLYVWSKELTGSEVGNVAVAGTGVNALESGMTTLAKTGDAWDTPVMVSGNDAVHDTNRSVICDSSIALQTGDMCIVAFGSDRGNAVVISSFNLTQSGATFGTAVEDNKQISNTDFDATFHSAHASVTAGSTAAPTIGWTYATSLPNCGPGALIRLREVSTVIPSGEAQFDALLTMTGSGKKVASGLTATGAVFAVSASGHKVARGAASVTAAMVPTATAGKKFASGYASYGVSVEMETFDVVPPVVDALVALQTHTSTVYNLIGEADEWSGARNEEPAIVDVPCSIIEQDRVVRKPQTGTPTVARDAIGRFPNGTPIGKTSRVIDSEGRIWSVVSTRQKRNPVWVGDVVVELLRTDQANL